MESDPIGLQGGLNTYVYAVSNPLSLFDIYGLSEQDVRDIHDVYDRVVEQLNENGQRMPFGPWNNINRSLWDVTGGKLGERTLGCFEQADVLLEELLELDLDDAWAFTRTDRNFPTPHSWITGTSSNDDDPNITADPWKGRIAFDYK